MASVALYSPSVLSDAAGGHRLPTLPVALAFARACGGDQQEWERRWREARGDGAPTEPLPSLAADDSTDPGRPRPAQLPIGPHDFVGRLAEFNSARSAMTGMADSRVPVVVRGPVGIGKTTFALRVAHQLTAEFPDGQLFADMGSRRGDATTPRDVMTGFLLALGIPPEQIPDEDMHRIGLYRSMLAERRVIVLLDNVRDEPQVRPLLARSLNSQIVVTSRSRLLGLEGVRRITLGPLSRVESIDLLRLLIGTDRVRTEHAAALRIAEFCGHLPLALTIAGRKISAQPGRRLSEIAGRLADGVNVASWLRIGDIGLGDAVLPAYLSRPPLAKHVLHMLAGGADEVTPSALSRALHISIDSAESAMDSLIDGGLLHRVSEPDRYLMSPLIGQLVRQEADRYVADRTEEHRSTDPLRSVIGFTGEGFAR